MAETVPENDRTKDINNLTLENTSGDNKLNKQEISNLSLEPFISPDMNFFGYFEPDKEKVTGTFYKLTRKFRTVRDIGSDIIYVPYDPIWELNLYRRGGGRSKKRKTRKSHRK